MDLSDYTANWREKARIANELRAAKESEFIKNNKKPDRILICKKHNQHTDYVVAGDTNNFYWKKEVENCPICDKIQGFHNLLSIPKRYYEAKSSDLYYPKYTNKNGVLFSGGVGTGKTYAIVQLIKHIYKKGDVVARFKNLGEILRDVRDSIGNGSYDRCFNKYANSTILVMDDIGAEYVTDFSTEFMYSIINYRYNEELPIIASTNLTASEFRKLYGERTFSRLIEMCELVKMVGDDRRISKINKKKGND